MNGNASNIIGSESRRERLPFLSINPPHTSPTPLWQRREPIGTAGDQDRDEKGGDQPPRDLADVPQQAHQSGAGDVANPCFQGSLEQPAPSEQARPCNSYDKH